MQRDIEGKLWEKLNTQKQDLTNDINKLRSDCQNESIKIRDEAKVNHDKNAAASTSLASKLDKILSKLGIDTMTDE